MILRSWWSVPYKEVGNLEGGEDSEDEKDEQPDDAARVDARADLWQSSDGHPINKVTDDLTFLLYQWLSQRLLIFTYLRVINITALHCNVCCEICEEI